MRIISLRSILTISVTLVAILGIMLFLRVTQEAPFEFTDKPLYGPLIQLAAPGLPAAEQRLNTIGKRLLELPTPTAPPTDGNSGYTSQSNPDEAHWVRFDFKQTTMLDAIAIVPAQRPEFLNKAEAHSLPTEIECLFLKNDRVVHRHLFSVAGQRQLRKTLPYFVEFTPIEINSVIIRDHKGPNNPKNMALSEIFLFYKNNNLTRRADLSSSSSNEDLAGFSLEYLRDGQTPLGLPQTDELHPFVGYRSPHTIDPKKTIEIVLEWEEPQVLDELLLFPTERLLGVKANTAGFPRHIRVEVRSNNEADWEALQEEADISLGDNGLNPFHIHFNERACQAIRILTTELWKLKDSPAILSLAEIQPRFKGNVIKQKPKLATNFPASASPARPKSGLQRRWEFSALTDGLSTEGRILQERIWLAGLAERVELLVEQNKLIKMLPPMRAKANRLCWRVTLGLPLIFLIGALTWFAHTQIQHQRSLRRVRNQVAADLHDDLGSNLSAITTFADQSRRQLLNQVQVENFPWQYAYMERLIRESIGSLKDLVSITAPQISRHVPLVARLREVAEIYRAGIDLEFAVEPELEDIEIPQTERRTLRMLLKEALNNCVRHSGANRIKISITESQNGDIWMRIYDNGCGMNEKKLEWIIENSTMRMRADDNKAIFKVCCPPSGGTEISVSIYCMTHLQKK